MSGASESALLLWVLVTTKGTNGLEREAASEENTETKKNHPTTHPSTHLAIGVVVKKVRLVRGGVEAEKCKFFSALKAVVVDSSEARKRK